jgi:hypothetical protein
MSTEIVKATPIATNLPDMVRYANHLADSGMLPKQFVGRPANVLWAMEYGRTLNITPIAAMTGIHVIEGKPGASAALISGLVRRAGHKLRVSGNGLRATAQIIRHDDPDFVHEVTWELRKNEAGNPNAEDAGLLSKDIWKKYPASMLKARAISQVARDACEEELFGLHYTPEELGAYVDQDGVPVEAPVQPLRVVQAEQVEPPATQREFLREAYDAPDAATVRQIWVAAGEFGSRPEYLEQIAAVGREKAAAEDATSVVDAVVVEEQDEHADALDALRAAALGAGVEDTVESDFAESYGVPIAEATVDQLRQMTTLLAGAA